jgi:hypothetical protein
MPHGFFLLRCERVLSSFALQQSSRVAVKQPQAGRRSRRSAAKTDESIERLDLRHPDPLPLACCGHLYMVGNAHLLPDERVPMVISLVSVPLANTLVISRIRSDFHAF